MDIRTLHLLACPICGAALAQTGTMLKCEQSHSFDIAKEGYVNLARKQQPGDTKEMLQARRAFLDCGWYEPVSEAINALLVPAVREIGVGRVLDAGCGEGYYGARLYQQLLARSGGEQIECVGIDVSKEAVRMAAKRYREMTLLVANLKERLPLVDEAVSGVVNIFAPRNLPEFARVLVAGGWLLIVIPGPTHISPLRERLGLLGIEEQKQQHVIEQCADLFELVTAQPVRYMLPLEREALGQLVMMTPNYWHLTPQIRSDLEALPAMEVGVDVVCLLFKLRSC